MKTLLYVSRSKSISVPIFRLITFTCNTRYNERVAARLGQLFQKAISAQQAINQSLFCMAGL